jgi:hypothetical protein
MARTERKPLPSPEEAIGFMNALDAAEVSVDGGKVAVDERVIAELVANNRELTEAAIVMYVRDDTRAGLQRALLLAGAYQLGFDDRTPADYVEMQRLRRGETDPDAGMELRARHEASGVPPVLDLEINPDALRDADIYSLQRRLTFDGTVGSAQRLRSMRGRYKLAFPLAHDPRQVWENAQARRYVSELAHRLPHVPYFLSGEPALAMVFVYFACFADATAFHNLPGRDGLSLHFDDPRVFKDVVIAMHATAGLARALGDDGAMVCREFLRACDAAYVDAVIAALRRA